MADDRCRGCQSFCMRGAQVLGQAPGESTDTSYTMNEKISGSYPTTWKQWQNFTGGTPNSTTIQSSEGLTANSQKDLITFILDGYKEGNRSVMVNDFLNTEEEQDQQQHVTTTPPGAEKPSYTEECEEDLNKAKKDYGSEDSNAVITSGSIIYAQNYNYLLPALMATEQSSVAKDPKGEDIPILNTISTGIIIGNKGSGNEVQHGDLIRANLYQTLAEKASKLLYHPYQCNICNIYENPYAEMAVAWALDNVSNSNGGNSADKSKWGNYNDTWYSMDMRNGTISEGTRYFDCSSFCAFAYGEGIKEGFVGMIQGNAPTTETYKYADFSGYGFTRFEIGQVDPPYQIGDIVFYSNGGGAAGHAALVQDENGRTVEARGSSYGIQKNVSPRSSWTHLLRLTTDPTSGGDVQGSGGNGGSGDIGANAIYVSGNTYDKRSGTYFNADTVPQVMTYEWGTWSLAVEMLHKYANDNVSQAAVCSKIIAKGGISQQWSVVLGTNVAVTPDNYILVATTSTFGAIGSKLKVNLSNGNYFYCVQTDQKSMSTIYGPADPANKWGHLQDDGNLSVIELWYSSSSDNIRNLKVTSIENLGIY